MHHALARPPCEPSMPADSYPKVKRTSWGYGQWAVHRSGRGTARLCGEAKLGGGHTPGFSEVGELFTLPDVDGNLTPLGAMLLILMALILRMIFDSELLQGGMQDSRKTLNVQAVTTNLGSCHFWQWLQRRAKQKACSKGKPKRAKVRRVVVP